jgi:hypothetical protein
VKLDPATLEPGSVATLVPPLNGKYTLADVDALRTQGTAIAALGAAVDFYSTFASSATPTGIGVIVPAGSRCTGTCPRIASQVRLPAGALAWGAAFSADSLFLGGVAPDGVFPGVKGESDGFVAKIVDLGLSEAAAPCKCVSIKTRAAAVHTSESSVTFQIDWAMTCTGGAGRCQGELAVRAPLGARIAKPARNVQCGPRPCTTAGPRGSFQVKATSIRASARRGKRYTFTVNGWCVLGSTRKALPAARITVAFGSNAGFDRANSDLDGNGKRDGG